MKGKLSFAQPDRRAACPYACCGDSIAGFFADDLQQPVASINQRPINQARLSSELVGFCGARIIDVKDIVAVGHEVV